ncbi:putative aldouronate transport system permease protein [Paenibacillus sp. UNCCL117]|uniref:carbohydrate ABC transporter permease n=1 Tax=unclassified Paenibacillus TaxID=185978 RepID=UPI0008875D0F|nr:MULTISPECIES: carbohydrate ABC transporter permease [unclassified Paenibacillus]SDE11159.1 putative aldouronate transport system permease protein [Paenibacillus sp. cl123]SFW59936.1 putative aldouronate transport system permease protein [Paenibacillus sp. UNCCL117]
MEAVTHKIRESNGDRIFLAITYTLIAILVVIVLYPLLYVVSASFSDPKLVIAGKIGLIPSGFNLEAYRRVFTNTEIWIGYRNTLLYTAVGTLINISMTMMGAYPLARRNFPWRRGLMVFFTITMFFSSGIIPMYLLVKGLGLYNSMWALILPTAISVYNMIVARTFLETNIDEQLYESAYMDGSGNIRSFFSIVLPLSAPIMAVLVLFYAVYHWNSYFEAMIYLKDRSLYPLQLFLREILVMNQSDNVMMDSIEMDTSKFLVAEGVKYAVIIVSSGPILMLYPFLQKYFVKGMMIGALKG